MPAQVVASGYTALKFDPFGAGWRVQERREEDLSIAIVAAVREAVGADVDLMIEAHCRFSAATALRIADRLAEHRPAWLEEPVAHHHLGSMVEVARRSPVPIATGESLTSLSQFADLLSHDAVHILQPEPLFLGGLWRTQQLAAMADAHYAVIAPHSAQGPICSAISMQLGASVPNFYIQESFDEFNAPWSRQIVDHPVLPVGGYVEVSTRPGLGIDLDWDRLTEHPYERQHQIRLFKSGWERRDDAVVEQATAPATPSASTPDPGPVGMTVEVVTLGECLVALIAESVGSLAEAARFERHVVGAEANVAVGLARLGHSVGYIGRVGDDAFGTAILRRLRAEGVDVRWLRVDAEAAPTGLLIRERQPLGPSEVLYRRAGSAGSHLTADGRLGSRRWRALPRRALAARHGHHPGTLGKRGSGSGRGHRARPRGGSDGQPGHQPAPQAVERRGRRTRLAPPRGRRGCRLRGPR